MKSKVVTDIELRSRWYANRKEEIIVPVGAMFTPAANDFIRENNITVIYGNDAGYGHFSMEPIPTENGRPVYVDDATGQRVLSKKENYTHLSGNRLVSKTHPQIALRGKLDSLIAEIIQLQLLCESTGDFEIIELLDEIVSYTKKILSSEVRGIPFGEIKLMGMNSGDLRYYSQNVKETLGMDHPSPSYTDGPVCASLNKLRTSVREVELAAVRAFPNDDRMDIVEAINRLSSAVYIIYCRKLKGLYGGTR